MTLLRRAFIACLGASALLAAAPAALAQDGAGRTAAAQDLGRRIPVVLSTERGDIRLELYPDRAPITVANFLRYVDEGRYAGATFYRVVRPDNETRKDAPAELIVGGLGARSPAVLPPIAHEPTGVTGLKHVAGAISMSRFAPGTATSDFFIVLADHPAFDQGGLRNPDGQGFAVFGQVVAGLETARAIQAESTDRPTDDAVVRGQLLDTPVKIQAVRRE